MSNTKALEQIKSYLDNRAKEDELFAKMYGKPKKDLNGCWAYIVGVARKRGNAVCMTDEEVYGLAVHYYCEDDLKVNPIPEEMECMMSTSENVNMNDSDRAKLRAEAEAEFKARVMKELAEAEKKKRGKEVAKAKRKQTVGMGCLFDF